MFITITLPIYYFYSCYYKITLRTVDPYLELRPPN